MIERTITWNYVSETNVSEIRIYRSTSSGFTPSTSNLITTVTPTITEYVDTVSDELGTYYYIVSMVRDDITVSTGTFKSEPHTPEPPPPVPTIYKPFISSLDADYNIITLTSSPLSSSASSPPIHQSTDWVIIGNDVEYGYSSLEDTDNLQSLEVDLRKTGTFEIRLRYNSDVVYSPWSDPYLYEYEYDGVPALDIGDIYAIDVDSEGNIYVGGSYEIVYKISPNGNILWEYTGHFRSVRHLVVDSNGYTFSGSVDQTVRKIDPEGNQVWLAGASNAVNQIELFNGFVYYSDFDQPLVRLNSDGVFVNNYAVRSAYNGLQIDDIGNIYI